MNKQIRKLLILLTLLTTSCASVHINEGGSRPVVHGTDYTLIKYVSLFEAASKMYSDKDIDVDNISVTFGDIKPWGLCRTVAARSEIVIDRRRWDILSEQNREQLMFHELGHCILKRSHCNEKLNGTPVSIMHESEFVV